VYCSIVQHQNAVGVDTIEWHTQQKRKYVSYLGYAPCKSRGMKFIPLDSQGAYPRYDLHTSVFAVICLVRSFDTMNSSKVTAVTVFEVTSVAIIPSRVSAAIAEKRLPLTSKRETEGVFPTKLYTQIFS